MHQQTCIPEQIINSIMKPVNRELKDKFNKHKHVGIRILIGEIKTCADENKEIIAATHESWTYI